MVVFTHPIAIEPTYTADHDARSPASAGCFPALGFTMPSDAPSSLNNWWCDSHTEYAFVGFSYEVTQCQSLSALKSDFLDIRKKFNGRYVRLYGACDRPGFYNDIVDAAWHAGVGVQALIWFGFNGDSKWMNRRDELFSILHSNPKAKFITRVVQFGSEPLFDHVLEPGALIAQVDLAKEKLASLRIPVTVSDLAYSFRDVRSNNLLQNHLPILSDSKLDGGEKVLQAIDSINAHILPFFSSRASKGMNQPPIMAAFRCQPDCTAAINSWPLVKADLDYLISQAHGKKIWFSQNGWPSRTSPGVQPNSPNAVANVQNEKDYYNMLDSHCPDLKAAPGGGVGWFAHIYSDSQEPGYGIYDASEASLKFPFAPRTSC
ncbi:hypothetical protein C0995_004468 [Termitomyces sp. Mi166|nr:hypothetical protein C0995_004468 [Termitomyces sp. Mi166\